MSPIVEDFRMRDNLVLVDVLSTKESQAILDQMVNLDREDELTKGLTVPQTGVEYQVVKAVAVSDQNHNPEGCELQLLITVGHYYLVSASRLSLIAGINTNTPQAFVSSTDILVEIYMKEEE